MHHLAKDSRLAIDSSLAQVSITHIDTKFRQHFQRLFGDIGVGLTLINDQTSLKILIDITKILNNFSDPDGGPPAAPLDYGI